MNEQKESPQSTEEMPEKELLEGAETEQVSDTEEQASKEHLEDRDLESELVEAQEQAAKFKDAYLRAKAEEENVRRRSEKEVANSRKFAVEGFAKELMQVADSLKLAASVELAKDADDTVKNIHDGVNITLKQMQTVFTKFSLSEIAPEVGAKLDPNLHQAMSMVESDEVESGCVLNVVQSGYQLHDRVLRPAMVIVVK